MPSPASSEDSWSAPPEELALSAVEVHVWRADLNRTSAQTQSLLQFLSANEIDRANRFHFQKNREHFVVARATLRLILGFYLRMPPEHLRFRYGEFGKPSLEEDYGSHGLRFNLSHSHGLALYAVAAGREVGIDVEFMRPEMTGEDIARRFFSSPEVRMLDRLPMDLRVEGFFNCWTRKEAYIKARGEGLSFPLEQFTVSLKPEQPAALLDVAQQPQEVERWTLKGLTPGIGYAAAVAAEGRDWQLCCLEWPPQDSPGGETH